MKKKIKFYIIILLAILVIGLVVSGIEQAISKKNDNKKQVEVASETDYIDKSLYYTYADIEVMVSYLATNELMLTDLDRLIDPLSKSDLIDCGYIRNVASKLELEAGIYQDIIGDLPDETYVNKTDFDLIYSNIVEANIAPKVTRQKVFIYEYKEETLENDRGVLITATDGINEYVFKTEFVSDYKDKIIDVYVNDQNIFKVNGYSDGEHTIKSVWINKIPDGICEILYDGVTKSYDFVSDEAIPTKKKGVADITVSNEGITNVTFLTEKKKGKVISITENGVRLENMGTLDFADDYRIYDIYGEPYCEESVAVLRGYSEVVFYVEHGKITAGVINKEIISTPIRVLISDSSYSSYEFDSMTISSDSDIDIINPDESESSLPAGKEMKLDPLDYSNGDIIKVKATANDGTISLLDLNRINGIPKYAGAIEFKVRNEKFYIINELPLETYLYSVVSSEMPSTYPPEALKAMAICTRGYAYAKISDASFDDYGADLDDSTICQVYNNVPATPETANAVRETYGIIPTHDETVMMPFYFSTSYGVTASNDEIWGGTSYEYLESRVDTEERENIDLSNEDNFKDFIEDSMGYDVIDKDAPYFRWNITFTKEEISTAINSMIEERIKMSPDNIKVKNANDNFVSKEITEIGDVISISVTERSVSGVVQTLEIEGTKETIQVSGQTNIRNLITPVNQLIIKNDGTSVTGWTSLPSPYYYVDETEYGFVLYGGGFGHGTGMSQLGAKSLAEDGKNYKFILRHYYSYIDFTFIYSVEEEEQ